MLRRLQPLWMIAALGACSTPSVEPPSLSPRAAETIDPRLPVTHTVPAEPVSPALAVRLAGLVDQARAGNTAFRAALADAERLTSAAGGRGSESWIAAQQALSAAVAARGPTARAVADIDQIAAEAIAAEGAVSAGDFQAIQAAAGEVAAIADTQAERINALQARLR